MSLSRLQLITLLLSAQGAALHAAEPISIAAFEYPPIYQNEVDKGLSGEIVIAAFKAANMDARLDFYPVTRMVHTVARGEAVCGIGGTVLFEAPELAAKVSVAALIQYVPQGFLYDSRRFPNGLTYERLADMNRYRVSVLTGSGIMKILEKENLSPIPSSTQESAARRLQMGSIDAWAIVDLSGKLAMQKQNPGEAAYYKNTPPFNLGDVSLICAKERDPDQRISHKFKEGLALIKKNGEYMRLMAKYYGSVKQINKAALADDMR